MANSATPARVRFAPSPTGHVHLGSARTALYNYLLAKKTGGTFILRIEDTDTKRYVQGAEEELINGLKWLGIQWDEGPDVGGPSGPYRQSERKDLYRKYAQDLLDNDKAFCCFCSPDHLARVREDQQKRKLPPHYDGTCRNLTKEEVETRITNGEKYVIRFKTPKEGTTTVHDHLRGDITVENSTLDDYILVKSDGLALYHLAAMVDDHLMNITHVIRGSEWLPTYPLHAMLYRAFGWEQPTFIHLSIFLKPSGKGKMSKRETTEMIKDGHSFFIQELKGLGYLPEAVVNWIVLMGWSLDDHTEFFTMRQLEKDFSIDHLNPSPAAINYAKFDHFNGLHIRALGDADLAERIEPFFTEAGLSADKATLVKIAPLVKERISTLDESVTMAGFFFKSEVTPSVEDLIQKGLTREQTLAIAQEIQRILQDQPTVELGVVEPPMRELVEKLGFSIGQVFGILRVAVTGQRVSPPLFESMEIVGREKVLQRIDKAIRLLS